MANFIRVEGYDDLLNHASSNAKTLGPLIAALATPLSFEGVLAIDDTAIRSSFTFCNDAFEVEVWGNMRTRLRAHCSICGASKPPELCRHAIAALCVAWDQKVGGSGPVYDFVLDADLEELVISCDVRCNFEGRAYGNEVFDAAFDSVFRAVEVHRALSLDSFIAAAEGAEDAYPLPVGLAGQLKSWQVGGSQRLQQVYHSGLGLLLADSMGLGKTIEVIARTLAICEALPSHIGPKAVVCCPGTLCDNWRREYGRFAPGLNVLRVGGVARLHHAQIATASDAGYDVVITSYNRIWRDAGVYRMAGWQPEVFALDDESREAYPIVKNGLLQLLGSITDDE